MATRQSDPKASAAHIRVLPGKGYEVHRADRIAFYDLSYSSIMSGVSASVVREIQKSSILDKGDINRIIPNRTLERRMQKDEALRPDEADAIARLLRVVAHAFRVFEDEELAEEWLRSPNPALNDEVPMTMAATDVGAREVEGVLTRLEHGIFD
ncbi:antitoxin Xre/MbcA/ParS toxin-binding domain-containing protein [Salipiger abyssi]|uniref:type II RES/Xre toxin-antitoxin system antitoxin n=1 Tax=Salipiger abyssi TaxID=1250539 RepID=UPI001A9027ED|nr:antitoxin Xre/MbcA/ParS toxin-binding domain-containing protein [Salipiger abyssi]MBN9886841.1 DUF2384 domain-containing protein [Salipiger abyssi]